MFSKVLVVLLLFECLNFLDAKWRRKNKCTCGKTFKKKQFNRIQGGSFVSENEFPWQAFVQSFDHSRSFYNRCGGALISKRHVLTAAHCVLKPDEEVYNTANMIDVTLGTNDVGWAGDQEKFSVSKVLPHPGWDNIEKGPDFAILTLSKPAKLSRGINTVCMPTFSNKHFLGIPGKTLSVAGWGTTSINGDTTDQLKKVKVKIIAKEICNNYKTWNEKYDSCLKPINKDEGTCPGDSGGPYTMKVNGRSTAIGLVSRGSTEDCSDKSIMTAITPSINDWIVQNSKEVMDSSCFLSRTQININIFCRVDHNGNVKCRRS